MRYGALALAALVAIASLGTQLSGASFSATKSNAGNSFAAAADFCSGGTQTLSASNDSYVAQNQASTNFGTATSTFVQSTIPTLLNDARRTVVQFNLPPIPAFCDLNAATLRLFATSSASGRTIDVQRLNGSWTETGVTWTNQPATTGAIVSASTGSGSGSRAWNVTSLVQAMYSGTNNGFQLKDQNELGVSSATQQYQSSEGTPDSQDPQLELTFG